MSEANSKKVMAKRVRRQRAHHRVRNRVTGTPERPRLAVFKSLRYLYAQVIDDLNGVTLAQANSSELAGEVEGSGSSCEAAKAVGKAVASRAKENGVETVVFDRGGFIYHGKVKALAEAAREEGLKF